MGNQQSIIIKIDFQDTITCKVKNFSILVTPTTVFNESTDSKPAIKYWKRVTFISRIPFSFHKIESGFSTKFTNLVCFVITLSSKRIFSASIAAFPMFVAVLILVSAMLLLLLELAVAFEVVSIILSLLKLLLSLFVGSVDCAGLLLVATSSTWLREQNKAEQYE